MRHAHGSLEGSTQSDSSRARIARGPEPGSPVTRPDRVRTRPTQFRCLPGPHKGMIWAVSSHAGTARRPDPCGFVTCSDRARVRPAPFRHTFGRGSARFTRSPRVFGSRSDSIQSYPGIYGVSAVVSPHDDDKSPDGLHHQGSVHHSPRHARGLQTGSPDRKLLEPRWRSRPPWLQPELRGEGGQPRRVPGPSVSTCWSSHYPGLRKRSLRESRYDSFSRGALDLT